MSDFDAARKRLAVLADSFPASELAADIHSLLAEMERLKAELAGSKESLRGHVEGVRSWQERAEKAEAEVERLEDELRSWHEGDNECCKLRHEAQIAREEALAEVERLREALRSIEAWEMPPVIDRHGKPSRMSLEYGSNGERDHVRKVARKALRGEGEK